MKKKPDLAPAAIARHRSISARHPGVESLESRIAPAAIATPVTFSYTDGDGDVVQVQVTGKAGTVEFLDALGGDVRTTGTGDLAQIIITKPSADFAISFADTNSATGVGIGDNIIELGSIAGAGDARLPIIKGIFTANSTPGVSYQLGGFLGTDFSPGGGLGIVGKVVGDGVGATTDVDLLNLGKGTSLSFGGVDAGASVQIAGKVVGNLSTPVLDGTLSLGTVVSGRVQIGHIGGTLTVQKDFGGRLVLGDPDPAPVDPLDPVVFEEVTILGSVLGTSVIEVTQNLNLHVTKDLGGAVLVGGILEAEVGGAMKGARITAGDDLMLDVTGAVADSSIVAQHLVQAGTKFKKTMTNSSIVGGTGLNLEVSGSVAKSRFSGGTGGLTVSISGKLGGSQFVAGGDAEVNLGASVDGSSILPDGRLTLKGIDAAGVTAKIGDVTKSIIGSKSDSATVEIGGKVAGSQFTAGTDLNLTIGKSLATSGVQVANHLTLEVTTSVLGTRVAVGSDADVTIGGQLASSSLIVSNNLDATIGNLGQTVGKGGSVAAGIAKSRLETSDGSMLVKMVGPVSGSVLDSGQHVTLEIEDLRGNDPTTGLFKILKPGGMGADTSVNAPGDVSVKTTGPTAKVAAKISAGHDAVIDVEGPFAGAITAANDVTFSAKSVSLAAKNSIRVGGDLSFAVTGDVVAPAIDIAGNVKDFHVGGGFNGGVNVAGNFVTGTTTASATVIGGIVGPSAFLHVGGDFGSDTSAPTYVFGKGFGGRLEIGGDLLTDLTFQGAVNRIAIDGRVGPATPGGPGNAVADIIVQGKLGSFSSASIFERLTANGGNFVNGAGTITGAIQADGGAPIIGPFVS